MSWSWRWCQCRTGTKSARPENMLTGFLGDVLNKVLLRKKTTSDYMKGTCVKEWKLTKRIVFLVLLSFILLQPVSVLAEEVKNIPNKIGKQISSDTRNEVITEVSNAFVEQSCQDDPTSWKCTQTKSVNMIVYVFFSILGILGLIGAIIVFAKLLDNF